MKIDAALVHEVEHKMIESENFWYYISRDEMCKEKLAYISGISAMAKVIIKLLQEVE